MGASLVEHGLQGLWVSAVAVSGLHSCDSWARERQLSSCGAGAELLHVTWDLPGSGIEPLASALAGKFFITRPQGWLVSMGWGRGGDFHRPLFDLLWSAFYALAWCLRACHFAHAVSAHTQITGTSLVAPWKRIGRQCRRQFDPWVRKTPWRREWQSTPVFWPGKSHGQRNLGGYSTWGSQKSWTRFSD